MSLAIQDAKNVVIKNFSVIQPQFWASIIIGSENVIVQDFYVNATSYNPAATYDRKSWLEVRPSPSIPFIPMTILADISRTPMVSMYSPART